MTMEDLRRLATQAQRLPSLLCSCTALALWLWLSEVPANESKS